MNNKKLQKGLVFFVLTFFIMTSSFSYARHSGAFAVPSLADSYSISRYKNILGPMYADNIPITYGTSSSTIEPEPAQVTYGTAADSLSDAEFNALFTDTDNTPTTVPVTQADPYEGFNRAVFVFNDTLDMYVIKPVATLYNKIIPRPLNQGIHNVFFNLNTLTTIIDDLLQANFYQAANDTWRVGINTTIGIGGLFDVAQRMHLEPYSNDFGLTLARWGYTGSNYLVLPVLGPNTVRDGIGIPVDYFAFSIYPYINPRSFRYEVLTLSLIDKRAQLLKFQDVMEEAALDKYVFVRSAYMQRRANQIEENNHRSFQDQLAAKQVYVLPRDL